MGETDGERAERLKAALRDNLRRRKAQERARTPGEAGERTGEPAPPAEGRDGEAGPDDQGGAPDLDTSRL
ncbi:hypothetical protein MTDSW087_01306 [Methylobacterium dankookense]|uniref:Uncharacterized protein n=1 Tax=Methylobacterium dankookense TaxID=560405 RepID=A0A564FUA3_9HYPH|nr:hypothetical protein [Methylobacterium dankookense]GJD59354.1 hypothetical protein IFDJLNFL_5282 [Methylobacterium dankookense]VUF11622.1 hypothetical protein MTDSW087_01306 [Methylobacterium dankookense]